MSDLSSLGILDQSKTNQEITDTTVPDPSPLPRVCGDYLLIRPVPTNAKKVGSIYIPESTQDDVKYLHNVGRILSFGPRAYKTKEGKIIDWVEGGLKIGDIVQWERFVGKKLRYKGVNLVLLKDVAVQLVVENAENLDPMTSIED
jgi:co-chaperonin GroES (HSP10)